MTALELFVGICIGVFICICIVEAFRYLLEEIPDDIDSDDLGDR